MKYQHVLNPFCHLIFTLSIICLPLSAMAAIVRTEYQFYDMATLSQRSYTATLLPAPGGAHLTLHRNDEPFTLVADVSACFNKKQSAQSEGYLWWTPKERQQADPALAPFLNFAQENRLRVAVKPLSNAQSLLLDKDSLTVLVVEPAMMTLGPAGCQR